MKSTYEFQSEPTIYPCIKIGSFGTRESIVLFTAPNSGVYLGGLGCQSIGFEFTGDECDYKHYYGTVTLSNT